MTSSERKELVNDLMIALNAKFVRKDVCDERHRPSWFMWTLVLGSYVFTFTTWLFVLERMTSK